MESGYEILSEEFRLKNIEETRNRPKSIDE